MRGFERVFASSLGQIRGVLDEALHYIRAHAVGISVEDEADMRLVLSELLLNAAIHGNRLDERKRVLLTIALSTSDGVRTCTIAIEDEGEGFDYRAMLSGDWQPDFESEHGRGVRLANALMDQFSFNEKGNRVVCAKRFKGMAL